MIEGFVSLLEKICFELECICLLVLKDVVELFCIVVVWFEKELGIFDFEMLCI